MPFLSSKHVCIQLQVHQLCNVTVQVQRFCSIRTTECAVERVELQAVRYFLHLTRFRHIPASFFMSAKAEATETVVVAETYQLKPFFLNIILLNKDEIVKNKAAEKAGNSVFGRAAAYTATKLVSSELVLGKISEKLMEGVKLAVSDMGINASVQKSFQDGPYVVIRVQVNDVEKLKLLRKAKGADFSAAFEVLLHSLTQLGLETTASVQIDKKIKDNIQEGLMRRFSEAIPQKLGENGVSVDVEVVTSEDQAEYFYTTLATIKEAK